VGRPAAPGLVSGVDGDGGLEPEGALELAEHLARATGRLLVERFEGPRPEVRSKSTPTDPVTEIDEEAERLIRDELAARRPGDGLLGEEGGDQSPPGGAAPTGVRWIVDPLDGTVNFLFGLPQWCVSVACEDAEGLLAGVIHDPLRPETFTATRGGRAARDGEAVRASEQDELARALVVTGFGYDADVRAGQAEVAARLLPRVRDLRRLGSAALDLAWLACGRYDAYYERGVKVWDIAAGALICRRAGLEIHHLPVADGLPAGLLVAPPGLVEPLRAIVEE
jgi:myo-inositol-1(or 4)-monophosphatase